MLTTPGEEDSQRAWLGCAACLLMHADNNLEGESDSANLGPEHGGVGLHGLLEVEADLRDTEGPARVAQLVQALYGVLARARRHLRLCRTRLALLRCDPYNIFMGMLG